MLNEDLKIILNKIEALDNLEIELEVDDTEIETISIHLFSREEFEEGQLGYSVDEEDNSLTGDSEGDWKETWYVIGYDENLGDPIFVDIEDKNYPVMTAMHGEGDWEPEVMFSSLNEFLKYVSN
ncbi:hypothetical protein [Bacillus pseudomycoides]|uniref:SMI1/KNR4 family protein n=1 Tax=Bacillus pseudomycoides TaxID=64104 RepID=A0A2B5A801_9BACI|nr:hypothetical protein bpmyx0001_50490 [Bacillus pseudomycoides DSM 12442]PDY08286.1 hypothetical protein COO16_30195 [Bacillus pseudomycoides]PEF73235.1 hypothetical protein CON94_21915 [Bacillus pseudomycoides]PEI31315.1 hypothetical protein CN620_29505 [Bacillus pseudomycoides]PEI38063.1 hypothetical protein CN641_27520 [Bacillus pseudomycoides]